MYRVECDGKTIYDGVVEEYQIFDTQLELELNKTGTFTFTIYPNHPNYDALKQLKSIITVYQGDDLIFRGRILNEEHGFYNQKQVTCEGELAFLLDSVVRPLGTKESPWIGTAEEFLRMLVEAHNAVMDSNKRFEVGIVDITNDVQCGEEEHTPTLDVLNEYLIDALGGYLWLRHEVVDGEVITYLDYLADVSISTNQVIEIGENLLDLKKTAKGEDVMTGIIPLGAKPDGGGSRITIAAKDGDADFIEDEEAVARVGRIFKTVTFEDITDPQELREAGAEYLRNAVKFPTSVELSSADLAGITDVDPFKLGQKIGIKDDYHGLENLTDETMEFLVEKLTLDILQPANNKLTVGATFSTFTENANSTSSTQNKIASTVSKIEKVSSGFVTAEALDAYYKKTESDARFATKEDLDDSQSAADGKYATKANLTNLANAVNLKATKSGASGIMCEHNIVAHTPDGYAVFFSYKSSTQAPQTDMHQLYVELMGVYGVNGILPASGMFLSSEMLYFACYVKITVNGLSVYGLDPSMNGADSISGYRGVELVALSNDSVAVDATAT